jgi:hypothetical protein
MADVCADLIHELVADSGVTNLVDDRVYGGAVPKGAELPFIWLQRRMVTGSGALEGEGEPLSESFDVEAVSDDSREAIEISDAVRAWAKSWCDARSCVMGDHTYTWVEVVDASEGYVVRNVDAGENLYFSNLDVEVTRP